MEQTINNKISPLIIISVGLWMMGAVLYSLGEKLPFGTAEDWWAFDKINDRLLISASLFIVSLRFLNVFVKLVCYVSMIYVVLRAYLELIYIYTGADTKEAIWAVSGLYCVFVMFLITLSLYVGSRRKF